MQELTFEKIQEDAKEAAKTFNHPKYEGTKKLLADLYPDKAHFIYELLQNAEDTGATEVSFLLEDDGVWFEHNGRSFTLKDIDAITSIGNSTKREDSTTIGKFGVGFKAVFTYTDSPSIYSGDYAFKITEFIVPDKVKNDEQKNGYTRFYFPFNHRLKSKNDAYQEISDGLNGLHDNALLFLKRISKLTYSIGKDTYSIERKSIDDHKIEIVRTENGQDQSSYWLRFDQEIKNKKEDNGTLNHYVSLAFSLKKDVFPERERWAIIPVDGQVSIFFPAENETPNLKFHIHAPFESTPARDSITKDTFTNNMLRDKLVDLFVTSMSEIKKRGFLTKDFLSVLPNKKDNLREYYQPFMGDIISAFNRQPLLPMKNKQYQCASKAYKASSKITDVIDDVLLAKLKKTDESTLWAVGTLVSTREYYFLESLDITEYGYNDLWSDLRHSGQIFNAFVIELSSKKLLNFYGFMNDFLSEERYQFNLTTIRLNNNLKLLKCKDEKFHSGSDDDRVYLLPKGQLEQSNENIIIDIDIEKYHYFLKEFNVVVLDKAEKILDILDGYDGYVPQYIKKHVDIVSDLEKVFDILSREQKQRLMNYKFLVAKSPNGVLSWHSPNSLYLDEPYISTKLSHFFPVLHEMYCIEDISLSFFEKLGIKKFLTIDRTPFSYQGSVWEAVKQDWARRGVKEMQATMVANDWDIKERKKVIEANPAEASFVIWNALINCTNKSVIVASYRPNAQYPIRTTDSSILNFLKNNAWIAGRDGLFYRSEDISRELLPEGYHYDENNFILKAINFGGNHKKAQDEYFNKNEQAKALGFENTEEARKVKALLERCGGVEGIEKMLAEKADNTANGAAKHQGRVVKNPDRRATRLLQRNVHLSKKEIEYRVRSVSLREAGSTKEAKAFLVDTYTSDDGKLICQCCDQVMPFKVNEKYYFEAVDCVKDLDKHYQENKLALCPTCAAMYQHANDEKNTIEGRIRGLTFNAQQEATVDIPVNLASTRCKITFSAVHLYDLKTTLEDLE